MQKYKTINLISTLLTLVGISYQIYCDINGDAYNHTGTYTVIGGLLLYAVNTYVRDRNKADKDINE